MEKYVLKAYRDEKVENPVCLQGDDKITYAVLEAILGGVCSRTYTDNSDIIICHSTSPYPVWVWCKDANDKAAMEVIGRCLKEEFPVEEGYQYMLSYEVLNHLKRLDSYFEQTKVEMNLLSYRLNTLQDIERPCDGKMEYAQEKDLDELAKYQHDGSYEMEGFDWDMERCRASVKEKINAGELFLWRNEKDKIVALTVRRDNGDFSKIASVYTLPDHRRKGYAINLVYQVTKGILADGLIPILYTNADYSASNSCYRKIGYEEVGSLCTSGK